MDIHIYFHLIFSYEQERHMCGRMLCIMLLMINYTNKQCFNVLLGSTSSIHIDSKIYNYCEYSIDCGLFVVTAIAMSHWLLYPIICHYKSI